MNEWKRLETAAIWTGANPLSTLLFTTCLVAGLGGSTYFRHPGPLIAGSLLGAYFLSAVKVAKQWERGGCTSFRTLSRFARTRAVPYRPGSRFAEQIRRSAGSGDQCERGSRAH